MKHRWTYAITLVGAIIALTAGVLYWQTGRASAAGDPVGFVDAEKVLSEYAPAISVNEELGRLKAESEETLRAKVRDKYGSADVATLPKENQLEIQQMVEEAENKFQSDIESIRGQKWEPILKQIRDTVGKVAADNGVAVVLQKDAVVFGGVDLTDKVIAELKKNAPAATTPAPAPDAGKPK